MATRIIERPAAQRLSEADNGFWKNSRTCLGKIPRVLDIPTNTVIALDVHGTLISGALEGERIDGTIETVAFPGLGTGVGRVSFETCAKQMRVAIEDVILGQNAFPSSWSEAQERHQRLYTNQIRDLQRE